MRQAVVIHHPQVHFYVGADAAERRNPLVFSPREWKMLWLCYCITSALVIFTVYLCLTATQPMRLQCTVTPAAKGAPAPRSAPAVKHPTQGVRYAINL